MKQKPLTYQQLIQRYKTPVDTKHHQVPRMLPTTYSQYNRYRDAVKKTAQ